MRRVASDAVVIAGCHQSNLLNLTESTNRTNLCQTPTRAVWKRIEIESRRQPLEPSIMVQRPVIVQVIVHVGDEDRICHPAPKLFDVGLNRCAVHPQYVHDLSVEMILGIVWFRSPKARYLAVATRQG